MKNEEALRRVCEWIANNTTPGCSTWGERTIAIRLAASFFEWLEGREVPPTWPPSTTADGGEELVPTPGEDRIFDAVTLVNTESYRKEMEEEGLPQEVIEQTLREDRDRHVAFRFD